MNKRNWIEVTDVLAIIGLVCVFIYAGYVGVNSIKEMQEDEIYKCNKFGMNWTCNNEDICRVLCYSDESAYVAYKSNKNKPLCVCLNDDGFKELEVKTKLTW